MELVAALVLRDDEAALRLPVALGLGLDLFRVLVFVH
jgi:hypothetical protein